VSEGASDIVSLDCAYGDGINLTAVNDNAAPANTVSLGYSGMGRFIKASTVPFRGRRSRSGFKPERTPPESLTPARFRICSVG
jgi:hypothetical protein